MRSSLPKQARQDNRQKRPGKHSGAGQIGSFVERRQAEEALRQSEAGYKTLAENPNSIVMRFDSEGRILFVNSYASELFGYTVEEMLGRKSTELIHPKVQKNGRESEDFFADLLQQPELYQTHENENVCKDGKRLWISWTNTPIFDEDGKLSGLISTGFAVWWSPIPPRSIKSS